MSFLRKILTQLRIWWGTLALLFIMTGFANASYWWNGTYWTDGTYNYTRAPYYVHNGCGGYSTGYTYTYVSTVSTYTAPTYTNSTDEIIANAVAARDKVKNTIVSETLKHQQFLEKIKAANLDKDIGYTGANNGVNYLSNQSLLLGQFGVNGSIVYGYSNPLGVNVNPYAVNLDQALTQQSQAVQTLSQVTGDVNKGYSQSVQLAFNKSAELSGITARRDAIVQFAKLLDGPPGTTSFKLVPAQTGPAPEPRSANNLSLSDRWNSSAQKSCVACHYGSNGERKDGGFSVADFPKMSTDQQKNVLARIELPATNPRHMPKGGESLTLDEYRSWVEVAAPTPATKPETLPVPKE